MDIQRYELSLLREELHETATAARELVAALRDLEEFPRGVTRVETAMKEATRKPKGRRVLPIKADRRANP